jgi:hypothetical protein
LSGGDGAEGYQELDVDNPSVVEEQSDNLLNMVLTVFVEEL